MLPVTRGNGWSWPSNSRRSHYFKDGRSLCKKWLFHGLPVANQVVSDKAPGPDDCRECWRAYQKLVAVDAKV